MEEFLDIVSENNESTGAPKLSSSVGRGEMIKSKTNHLETAARLDSERLVSK